jgi:hypothetical protein
MEDISGGEATGEIPSSTAGALGGGRCMDHICSFFKARTASKISAGWRESADDPILSRTDCKIVGGSGVR